MQARAAAVAHLAVAEAVLEAQQRTIRARRQWAAISAAAETAVAEGRWEPPSRALPKQQPPPPSRRPLTELEEVIRDANRLANEVQVRLKRGGGGEGSRLANEVQVRQRCGRGRERESPYH